MKALTVQQPWAWAIVHGGKDVENRTTAWRYRGPLAIHAGTRWSYRGAASALTCGAIGLEPLLLVDEQFGPRWPALAAPLGAVIGVVDLVDVHLAEAGCCESTWAEGAYVEHGGRVRRQVTHLALSNPQPCLPVVVRGSLGLWDVADDLLVHP